MATRLRDAQPFDLRYEPTEKRIRATLGGQPAVDSTRALLVWEPRRVVPCYAVPEADVEGELTEVTGPRPPVPGFPMLDPRIPFQVHTADGEPLVLLAPGGRAGAFRAADPDLAGHVLLDFAGFDAWYEEDERNFAHPRDPFHRIDILQSSRTVRVERDGELLAASSRPRLLFETRLPTRFYFPAEDVALDRMHASPLRTWCAYKGEASYLSAPGAENVAWTYPSPQREAAEIQGLIAFFDEHVDVTLDGQARPRPVTPWS
jgi:uncharacterized protein (DUF427 family)